MTKRNAMNDLHAKVLRKFHTLCHECGLTEYEKTAIVSSFGVESSADIDTHDLIDVCNKLAQRLGQQTPDAMDKLRKQALASIGGYLKKTGKESSSELIKAIACRCTGYESFNKIPAERLRNCYYTFLNKQKDMDKASEIAAQMVVERLTEGKMSRSGGVSKVVS